MKIEKDKLENFAKKYNLKKKNESVKWTFLKDDNCLKTRFITSNKSVLGEIEMFGIHPEENLEVGVFSTEKLLKMLNVTSGEIEMDLEKNESETDVSYMVFKDNISEVKFMASKLTAIPKVPLLKALPEFTFGIEIGQATYESIKCSKSALAEEKNFTLIPQDSGEVDMVIGYSENTPTNRIKIKPKLESGKESLSRKVSFSSEYLYEIIVANSEFFLDDKFIANFRVSENGMAQITFDNKDFSCKYYFIEITNP